MHLHTHYYPKILYSNVALAEGGSGNPFSFEKGLREFDWAWIKLMSGQQWSWGRWLLARRKLSDPTQLAYFRQRKVVFTKSKKVKPLMGLDLCLFIELLVKKTAMHF